MGTAEGNKKSCDRTGGLHFSVDKSVASSDTRVLCVALKEQIKLTTCCGRLTLCSLLPAHVRAK